MGEVAGRFPRREPRLPAREMAEGDPRPGMGVLPMGDRPTTGLGRARGA